MSQKAGDSSHFEPGGQPSGLISLLGWLWPLSPPVSFVLGVSVAEAAGLGGRSPVASAVLGAGLFWLGHLLRKPLGVGADEAISGRRSRQSWRLPIGRLVRPGLLLLTAACLVAFYWLASTWSLLVLSLAYLLVDRWVREARSLTALRVLASAGLVTVLALVLALTLGRHLLRWYALQDSTIPTGTDLATYYWGPVVLFDQHLDPYDNAAWRELLASGSFDLGHSNPRMAEVVERNIESQSLGYVASPFDLLLFRPTNWSEFGLVYNLWPIVMLLTLSVAVGLFSWRLSRGRSRRARFLGALAAIYLLVFVFEPALSSVLGFGQLEGLYVPLVLVGIGAIAFRWHRRWTPIVAGAALAMAAAIKVFPAILGLVLAASIGSVRGWKASPPARALIWALGSGITLVLSTLLVAGPGTVGAWISKLGSDPFVRELRWRHDLASHFGFASLRWTGVEHGLPSWLRLGFAAVFLAAGFWWINRRLRGRPQARFLFVASLSLVVLPTLMPLWWNLYHVVLAVPILVCFWTLLGRDATDSEPTSESVAVVPQPLAPGSSGRPLRWAAATLLALAYCGLNAYALIDHIVGWLAPGSVQRLPVFLQRVIAESVGYPATLFLLASLLICASIAGGHYSQAPRG